MKIFSNDGKAVVASVELVTVERSFDGRHVAEIFWTMGADQQAAFFDEIGKIAWANGLSMQLEYIRHSSALTILAKSVMKKIGDYGE